MPIRQRFCKFTNYNYYKFAGNITTDNGGAIMILKEQKMAALNIKRWSRPSV